MNKYTRLFFATAIVALLSALLLNTIVDPAWYICHSNRLNAIKFPFDERVQKTNRLMHSGKSYDGLLFGSSRVSYIDARKIPGADVYNYALGSMYPEEYAGYIAGASRRHRIRTVYIGLDFFGTAKKRFSFAVQDRPEEYFEAALNPMRILGSFLSADSLRYALKTASMSLCGRADGEYYDADFLKRMSVGEAMLHEEIIYRQLVLYHEQCYGPTYAWNPALPEILRSLRRQWPELRFVAFTTPISAPMFSLLVHDGRLADFERWIRLLVEAFGSVHDFMGFNSVTTNLDNYADAHHFKEHVGEAIIGRISGQHDGIPDDFGILVTPGNLEQHLADIRAQAARAAPDPLAAYGRLAGQSSP